MRIYILMIAGLFAAASVSAQSSDDLDFNRRKLEQWRQQPEQLARLRANAQAFLALSPERKKAILRLDQDLREESSTVQARLNNVWDRYLTWLDQLRKDPQRQEDYQRIVEAPDKATRLAAIRAARDTDWLLDQPKALQADINRLGDKERTARIKKLQIEERQRARDWFIADRFWFELVNKIPLPARITDLPDPVQNYVNDYLKPMLNKDEKTRLDKAQGEWPRFPITLVELADAHPPALPGPVGPKRFTELPNDIQNRFTGKGKFFKSFPKGEGRWPEFAWYFSEFAHNRKIVLPHELWPYNFGCLSPAMQKFVKEELEPALDKEERIQLSLTSERWPNYPDVIQLLAQKHHLTPPWLTLPPDHKTWDKYRLNKPYKVQGFPELPQRKLREFFQSGLNAKDREALKQGDPAFWQRLYQMYFERNPQELKNLRQRDQRKIPRPNPVFNFPKEKLDKLDI